MPKITPLAERKVSGGAFDIWNKANQMEAQGIDVIRLEIGEPDYPTPMHIVDAGERAMRAGRTGYDAPNGTLGLRQAVAAYLTRTRNIEADPARVSISVGVKGTLFAAVMMTVPPGGEILVPDPGYPMYQTIMAYAGGTSVPYVLSPENRFQPDPAEIEKLITPKTSAILINSPSNPTGTLISHDVMEEIARIAVKHDLWVLSDEVYAQIYFGDEFPVSPISFPGMAERTILMDGCSKAYNMTGWRVGFGYYPEQLLGAVSQLSVHTYSSLPPFIMDAAETAFNGPQECVAEMVAVYKERAAVVCDKLESVPGISAIRPDGAFYVMVDVSKIAGKDDRAAAQKVLAGGVSILPGSGMGKQSEGFFRISLTQPADVINTAIDRMVKALT